MIAETAIDAGNEPRSLSHFSRYAIESFVATQAIKYSRSTIRSMRIALGLLLSLRSEERMAEGGFQQRSETAEC